MIVGNFQICGVNISEKMHLRVEKLNLDISTCAPGSYHNPLDRGKLLISNQVAFFLNLFPTSRKCAEGGGAIYIDISINISLYYCIFYNKGKALK